MVGDWNDKSFHGLQLIKSKIIKQEFYGTLFLTCGTEFVLCLGVLENSFSGHSRPR